ncbi:hypothetical protein KIN20_005512 [Parelaphostrongylus tenuis]|uniref:Uncharacterized protein n=1 Tax=Parelaphostrongylus tenuis TaxID=148309 RepID=A0AAD5QIM5_PARTN|nr:hypothetical protein KIN20_005512 [Parelaphostrongylus tenuis]
MKGDEEVQLLMEHQENSSTEEALMSSGCRDWNSNRAYNRNHKSRMVLWKNFDPVRQSQQKSGWNEA